MEQRLTREGASQRPATLLAPLTAAGALRRLRATRVFCPECATGVFNIVACDELITQTNGYWVSATLDCPQKHTRPIFTQVVKVER